MTSAARWRRHAVGCFGKDRRWRDPIVLCAPLAGGATSRSVKEQGAVAVGRILSTLRAAAAARTPDRGSLRTHPVRASGPVQRGQVCTRTRRSARRVGCHAACAPQRRKGRQPDRSSRRVAPVKARACVRRRVGSSLPEADHSARYHLSDPRPRPRGGGPRKDDPRRATDGLVDRGITAQGDRPQASPYQCTPPSTSQTAARAPSM
jgi:hypothetical protein